MTPRPPAAGSSLNRLLHQGVALGLALVCSGAPRRAEAQSARDVAAARQAFREGEDAESRGDLAIAVTKFRQALAIKATAQLHLRIGAVEEKLGRLHDALGSYERGLEKSAALPAVAKVAREQIDALRPRVPVVTVVIDRPPPDLIVTLDGAPLAAASIGVAVPIDPGAHRLHAQAPGWLQRDQAFDAAERSRSRIVLDLLPIGEAKPPPPPPPPSRIPAGVLTGGGAAVFVAGAVMFADSYVRDGVINGECGGPTRMLCPQSSRSQILSEVTTVNVLRFVGVFAGVVGAAGVGGGAYLLARSPAPQPPSSAGTVGGRSARLVTLALAPRAGPGFAGAALHGRF